MIFRISSGKALKGEIKVPGDKSISHRAVMLGALAEGCTEIENFLMGEDCLSTIDCFKKMGVDIEVETEKVTLRGKGLRGLVEPADILDVGNSGTTIRLLMGILAGQKFFSVLTGDSSIRKRPMARVTEPLTRMGANISGREKGKFAPIAIGEANLSPIDFVSPVASAQVKSAVLLAGLFTEGETSVTEPIKSRDHTERMLQHFGTAVRVEGNKAVVTGFPRLQGQRVEIPGDISSAAFYMVAGLIVPGSEILIKNVGINPTRDGILEILTRMGGNIEVINGGFLSGEPVADLLVRSSSLRGTEVSGAIIPRLIDELPVLAVAAAVAEGETIIKDATELKVKETNRIATLCEELAKFGVDIEERPDGMSIRGGAKLKGAVCTSHGDHRIAMSMAIAGLVAEGETTIEGWDAVKVSFPNFDVLLKGLRA